MRLNVTSILLALSLILGMQPLTAQVVDPALADISAERMDRYTNYLQQEIDAGKAPSYGYGFGLGFDIITNLADTKALGSVGRLSWIGAFQTFFFIDPAENLAAVLMTQIDPYDGFYGRKMSQFVYQSIVD